jgi:hypothetical protein
MPGVLISKSSVQARVLMKMCTSCLIVSLLVAFPLVGLASPGDVTSAGQGGTTLDPWFPPLAPRAEGLELLQPPVRLRVKVGFDVRGRTNINGSWVPVTVWFRTPTPVGGNAQLTLTAEDFNSKAGGASVRTAVGLPPMSERIVRTALFLGAGHSRVQLRFEPAEPDRLSNLNTYVPALTLPDTQRVFVVIGSRPCVDSSDDRPRPHTVMMPYITPGVVAHPALDLPRYAVCTRMARTPLADDVPRLIVSSRGTS